MLEWSHQDIDGVITMTTITMIAVMLVDSNLKQTWVIRSLHLAQTYLQSQF